MPELPEVETVASGLKPHLTGRTIAEVTLNRPDLRVPFPDDFQDILTDASIVDVARRAKYLLFHLNNGHSVIGHLGMSGTLRFEHLDRYEASKHDHMIWVLDDGSMLVFKDPRRFGLMMNTPTRSLMQHDLLAHLGPEPLSDDFNADYLRSALSERKSEVKVALMDQKLVVGVGNIYASEALFRAKINPFARANMAAKDAKKLVSAIKNVLQEAIASGGSTIRDYARSDGDSGYFQHAFMVYERADKPCVVCQKKIARATQAGRSTYFCNKCQGVSGFSTPDAAKRTKNSPKK